jgi:hypothetical protein
LNPCSAKTTAFGFAEPTICGSQERQGRRAPSGIVKVSLPIDAISVDWPGVADMLTQPESAIAEAPSTKLRRRSATGEAGLNEAGKVESTAAMGIMERPILSKADN